MKRGNSVFASGFRGHGFNSDPQIRLTNYNFAPVICSHRDREIAGTLTSPFANPGYMPSTSRKFYGQCPAEIPDGNASVTCKLGDTAGLKCPFNLSTIPTVLSNCWVFNSRF